MDRPEFHLLKKTGVLRDRKAVSMLLGIALSFVSFLPAAMSHADELEQKLIEMTFLTDSHDWRSGNHSRAFLKNGALHVEAIGGEPSLSRPSERIGGRIRLVLRIRTRTNSTLTAFWTTRGSPRRSEDKSVSQTLQSDGHWHEYELLLSVPDVLTGVMLRFGAAEGTWEIESITAYRRRNHPISVQKIVPYAHRDENGALRDYLRYTIYNDAPVPLKVRADHLDEEVELPGRKALDFAVPIRTVGNLATVNLVLHPRRFPTVDFPVFLYREEGQTDWISRPVGTKTLDIAPDGRMARLRQGEDVFAVIAPLVHCKGRLPDLKLLPEASPALPDAPVRFESEELEMQLHIAGESIRISISGKETSSPDASDWEGPVVRLFGALRSGLLPGVEYLGPGDVSSSEIDIEAPYNQRNRPDPAWITIPMAVLETDRGTVILHWNDMRLRPTFASPNSVDRTDDHRLSLVGRQIEAYLELPDEPEKSGESAVLRALRNYVQKQGLPDPLPAPRDARRQQALSLQALRGPLQSEDAARWGYAVEADWPREPYADHLSTLARLEPRIPNPKTIVSGGSDIVNDAIYFLTGRVEQWKTSRDEAIRTILSLRNPDGSFFYRTRFMEVESSITSVGHTAIRALEIMEFVRLTGDGDLFEEVKSALEYLDSYDIPRGGFYRDTPLHTPDLYTAASLLWLYTWAHEFTGEPRYLELAQRSAVAGLPFVYLRTDPDHDDLLYAAVPKFGGTERGLPLWFGVAQPRVGLVYAYALNLLARHDRSIDWSRVAQGILHAAERMQFPDGPYAGCIPDAFDLKTRQRGSWKVNPCALVSLRLALEGRVDSLDMVHDKVERYVSPFPIRMTRRGPVVEEVPEGCSFQILRNGSRVIDVQGSGPVNLD